MAAVDPDGFGDGHKRWLASRIGELWCDAEFFLCFAMSGVGWVFVWFDVASWGKPELSVDVINQETALIAGVDHNHVGHQVRGRGRRLGASEHVVGGFEPANRLGLVLCFEFVEWSDLAHELMNFLHGSTHDRDYFTAIRQFLAARW